MKDPVVCNSKVFYDGEFAAQRAAAITEHKWGEEMTHYQCGSHWHIAHKKQEERNRFPRREKNDWCEVCKQPINPMRWWKHILTGSHIRRQQMLEEKIRLQQEKTQG